MELRLREGRTATRPVRVGEARSTRKRDRQSAGDEESGGEFASHAG